MIDAAEIENAVASVIRTSGLFPRVAWANRDLAQVRPYLTVAVVPVSVDDETIGMTLPVWTGMLMIAAVIEVNTLESPGHALLKQAGDLFTAGARITLASGKKLICGHPTPLPPYREGTNYRLPMRINLTTEG